MHRNLGTILALLTGLGSGAGAQAAVRVPLGAGSKLSIDGTSSLHNWRCASSDFNAAVELDSSSVPVTEAFPRQLRAVRVRVPVRSLTCSHDSYPNIPDALYSMNSKTYTALDADTAPDITFVMTSFDTAVTEVPIVTARQVNWAAGIWREWMVHMSILHVSGILAIAGQARPVTFDATSEELPGGSVRVTATVPIRMSDYGISPPSAFFGTLRAGNDVTVKVEATLSPTTTPVPPPE